MSRKSHPWGTETPGARLRSTAVRARAGLEAATAPGIRAIEARVSRAVTDSRALLEALEHIAREGFRGRGRDTPIPAGKVEDAAGAVRDALVALADASAETLSERYAAFAGALGTVLELAESAQQRGIAGSGRTTRDDPWRAFER